MSLIDVKMAYDDHDLESELTGLECKDVSLAVQSSRDEVDINTIVKRFGLTGQLPHDLAVPRYEDFENVFDFQSAMNMVREAEVAFMKLPAAVRARFGNSPDALVDFVSDGGNYAEAVKLGIAMERPPEVKEVVPGPVLT